MACEICWLRRTSDELEDIFQFYFYLAGEQVATSRIGRIIHMVDHLEKMPLLGMQDEEFTQIRDYRYLVILTYRIYYFVEDDNVFIASIWDCGQGMKAF